MGLGFWSQVQYTVYKDGDVAYSKLKFAACFLAICFLWKKGKVLVRIYVDH